MALLHKLLLAWRLGLWGESSTSLQALLPNYELENYNAVHKIRGSVTVWLDKGMQWFAAAGSKRGRSPKFSDAAI